MKPEDKAKVRQAIKAFWVAITPLAKDRQEVLAAITVLRQLLEIEPVQADEPVAWPLATEEEKEGGWTLSYKFLESLSDRIASHPAMETIEDVLLMAGSVAPPAQPAPVRHPRWYCIDKNGAAILCADEDDARQNAKLAEQDWPRNAPYRAVQLCAVYDAEAANGITGETK